MIQRKRSRLSFAEKADIWRRWKCGQSMHEIGRVHGRPHNSVHKLLLAHGGITPIIQAQLDQVSLRLNQRPRKTLGFETPADKLQASVASTI